MAYPELRLTTIYQPFPSRLEPDKRWPETTSGPGHSSRCPMLGHRGSAPLGIVEAFRRSTPPSLLTPRCVDPTPELDPARQYIHSSFPRAGSLRSGRMPPHS